MATIDGYWVKDVFELPRSRAWICTRQPCQLAAQLEGCEMQPCPPLGLPRGYVTCRVCKRTIGKKEDNKL